VSAVQFCPEPLSQASDRRLVYIRISIRKNLLDILLATHPLDYTSSHSRKACTAGLTYMQNVCDILPSKKTKAPKTGAFQFQISGHLSKTRKREF
jgi:hypothetical protein